VRVIKRETSADSFGPPVASVSVELAVHGLAVPDQRWMLEDWQSRFVDRLTARNEKQSTSPKPDNNLEAAELADPA
jgi:hypothetical protein